MMTNLFSVFDPCTGIFSMNWLSTFMVFILMPYSFWILPNKSMMFFHILISKMHKENKSLMKLNGSSLIMLSMFLLILINNMMGLLPYIFTSSAHLVFCLSLALPMWMALMIYGWVNKTNHMFIHLVPVGTPTMLMPFMVMIETISNLIRPGSLAVRLTANMIAGHLLMSLMGGNSTDFKLISLLMFMFVSLMIFEMAVAIIQSYVFMTLTNLYSSEI